MGKQKIRFIINPISGKKHKEHLPQQIKEHLDLSKFDYEICVSEYPSHAIMLAQDAINQHFDILAVAGGDGSVNEVGTRLIGTDLALAFRAASTFRSTPSKPCKSSTGTSSAKSTLSP